MGGGQISGNLDQFAVSTRYRRRSARSVERPDEMIERRQFEEAVGRQRVTVDYF